MTTALRKPLGFGVWAFIVFKAIEALEDLDVLSAALNPQARAMIEAVGQDLLPSAADGVFLSVEILAIVLGIVLIFRRHVMVRRYWIVVLGFAALWYAVVGLTGDTISLLRAVFSAAWLAYWYVAKRPRELAIEGARSG